LFFIFLVKSMQFSGQLKIINSFFVSETEHHFASEAILHSLKF